MINLFNLPIYYYIFYLYLSISPIHLSQIEKITIINIMYLYNLQHSITNLLRLRFNLFANLNYRSIKYFINHFNFKQFRFNYLNYFILNYFTLNYFTLNYFILNYFILNYFVLNYFMSKYFNYFTLNQYYLHKL